MTRHVLIILGHPAADSFGGAIAQSYLKGAQEAGHQAKLLTLNQLQFDPVMHQGYKGSQTLEPSLQAAQADLQWAQEIVFIFPLWWGGMPALLKGFLDRTLLPGFAFKYEPKGKGLTPMLTGRTARLIITMDTPRWIDRWLYGSPVVRQFKYPILRFCGIKLKQVRYMSPVVKSTANQRTTWLKQMTELAQS
ncbi:MAG: NAD(P)H-dependent oxidoreductase [Aquabacterium sp.]|nr:NAD(P)H-dependent oxidoreductase [Aquabacterium sp.]